MRGQQDNDRRLRNGSPLYFEQIRGRKGWFDGVIKEWGCVVIRWGDCGCGIFNLVDLQEEIREVFKPFKEKGKFGDEVRNVSSSCFLSLRSCLKF